MRLTIEQCLDGTEISKNMDMMRDLWNYTRGNEDEFMREECRLLYNELSVQTVDQENYLYGNNYVGLCGTMYNIGNKEEISDLLDDIAFGWDDLYEYDKSDFLREIQEYKEMITLPMIDRINWYSEQINYSNTLVFINNLSKCLIDMMNWKKN